MTEGKKRTVRLPEHLDEAISRRAEKTGNSAVAVIRSALIRQFETGFDEDGGQQ